MAIYLPKMTGLSTLVSRELQATFKATPFRRYVVYFTQGASHKVNAFRACSNYIRKLGCRDGEVFERRYFYIGKRYGVRIFESYDINTNTQQTMIYQRLIWQERHPEFRAARKRYRHILKDHHRYMELFN